MGGMSRSASEPLASRPIVVLGNPENRRAEMFCDAARRLDLSSPRVIAYETVLAGKIEPREVLAPGDCLRIESPGENEAVHRGLLALGVAMSDEPPADYDPVVPIEFGRIDHPRLWYRGFSTLLLRLEQVLEPLAVAWMNHPADIRLLFDKAACPQHVADRGIPVPRPLGSVRSYEELRARMREQDVRGVFAKLNYGSSASGVVAFRAARGKVCATTSVEMVNVEGRLRLFNSLRVREYRDEREVAALFDALGPLGLHVESWIPKASCPGGVFDMRVLVIAAEPRHVVMRVARGPLTNLHLGNRRGDAEAFLASLDPQALQSAWDTCRRVAQAFPRSLYLGIDLMFTPKLQRHYVLEVNAFGDLLPGILHKGDDTYTAELRAWTALPK